MRVMKFLGTMLLLIAAPAIAKDGGSAAWIVSQKSGQVQVIRSGMQPASAQLRTTLTPGDVVATGADGRVMLTHGGDYIVVAPRSRLQLPKEPQPTGFTRLVQQVGTMLYKVRHTGVPHFAVETPMLAAVVKGTSFTVIVEQDRSAVQVTEGLVEVSSASGSTHRLVERGVTVIVGRARPNEIIEMKPGQADLVASGGSDSIKIEGNGDVPLSTIASQTGGLIREAPVTTTVAAVDAAVGKVVTVPVAAPSVKPAPTANAPALILPDSSTPAATTPAVTTPAVTIPAVTTPASTTPTITTPVATIPAVTVPAVSVPSVTLPSLTVPSGTTPTVSTPTISTPTISTPTVSTPAITTPAIVTPVVTVPTVTVPTVTVPTVTIPTITVPAVTVPTVTTPVVTTPVITTPTITTPAVTTPVVTVPAVTVPSVTVPAVTVPVVTVPVVTIPSLPTGKLLGL